MRQNGMGVGVLSAITDAHLGKEKEFLDFFKKLALEVRAYVHVMINQNTLVLIL